MRRDRRDLAHAGAYLCAVALLIGAVGVAGAVALSEAAQAPLFGWFAAMTGSPSQEQEHDRIKDIAASAREIRAALARPVAVPEPLPPITAKLAHGNLRPGAPGARTMAPSRRALSSEARDAMAMDAPSFRSGLRGAVIPDLHKVY
jgi:hypothetical protein